MASGGNVSAEDLTLLRDLARMLHETGGSR
jgi:hypothetical protein